MTDYISRESALKRLKDGFHCTGYGRLSEMDVEHEVSSIPAADVAPVVHGRWIERPYLLGTTRYCSRCGENYGMPHAVYNFCPNCGAKMDGGTQDAVD